MTEEEIREAALVFAKRNKNYKKTKATLANSDFADFFLHASDEQKKKVFTEVAKQANKDQMETYKRANLKLRANEQR